MLGDKIGTGTGKTTGIRVLPGETSASKKMEISFEAQETWFKQKLMINVTATMWEKAPGVIYGEINGIGMSPDGEGVIFDGIATLTMGEGGTMKIRGAESAATRSKALSRLNGVLMVTEVNVAADQTFKVTHWEWK